MDSTSKLLELSTKNLGNKALDRIQILLTGKNSRNFHLIKPLLAKIQQTDDQRMKFRVVFEPLSPGTKNVIVRISGIRPDGTFVRRVKLTGIAH